MKNQESLESIKEAVLFYLPDSEVRLFGSRAKNKFDSDSDFDVFIITNQQIDIGDKFPLKTGCSGQMKIFPLSKTWQP